MTHSFCEQADARRREAAYALPYAESDLIVNVDGTDRGLGRPELSSGDYEIVGKATECTITVDAIDVEAGRAAGHFTATLEREHDEVGGHDVDGPRTFTVKGAFDVAR